MVCLLIFTMVLLVGRLMKLVDMVVNKGVSLIDISILFGTLLPSFLSISLPLAFLMGIMIGLGRMSADSETIALKAAGISLANIARPIIALSLIFALLSGFAGLWLKPWGYRAFRDQVFEITKKKATVGFQPQVFMKQFENIVLYANSLDNRSGEMADLFIVEESATTTSLIFAERGNIIADEHNDTVTFRLHDGVIHRQPQSDIDKYQLIHFSNYDVQPDLESYDESNVTTVKQRTLRPKELPTRKLLAALTEGNGKQNALKAELHNRLCTPIAPLLFALFGLPFSIQSHRSGRSGGFVIGLVIYICYYIQLSIAETITAESGVSPYLSFWLPHGLLFIAGLYCLYQSSRERTNPLVNVVDQLFLTVRKKTKAHHDHD